MLLNMFTYTENYIESHTNIRNNSLKYKTYSKHQITFSKIHFFKNKYFSKTISSWPAFGGPKFLVYIYIYYCVLHRYRHIRYLLYTYVRLYSYWLIILNLPVHSFVYVFRLARSCPIPRHESWRCAPSWRFVPRDAERIVAV